MSIEVIRDIYRDIVVIPGGVRIISAEASTPPALEHDLGDKLSEYTLEQGGDVPEGTIVVRSRIRKIGPFTVRRTPLGARVLVP